MIPDSFAVALLILCGIFTFLLGIVHVFMPVLFDFRNAIPHDIPRELDAHPLKPFRLLFYRYDTTRRDVHGIAYVMNHAVSFTLISIGVFEICAAQWIDMPWAWIPLLWVAMWWLLRALCQLYLGRRGGDFLVMGWFVTLTITHLVILIGVRWPPI